RLLATAVEARAQTRYGKPFSFSAGIAAMPEHGATRHDLYTRADTALYDAKRHGRTDVRIFDQGQARPTLDGAALASQSAAVADVVKRSALRPAYQPIVDLGTGRVIGFEGLVRPAPDSGFPDPSSLFSVAEVSGRMFELDHAAIQAIAAGAGSLDGSQFLSVNLSPRTIETPEFSPAGL